MIKPYDSSIKSQTWAYHILQKIWEETGKPISVKIDRQQYFLNNEEEDKSGEKEKNKDVKGR